MRDRILYPQAGRRTEPLTNGVTAVPVSNGTVRVGDYVRELPANHIQPCDCCLCRPSEGERPAMRVVSVGERGGALYVRLEEDYECPAEELELVELVAA